MRRLYWYDALILRLVLDDFFRFWVFLVHPTVESVLLSALVERFSVSRMRDFSWLYWFFLVFLFNKKINLVIGAFICTLQEVLSGQNFFEESLK